MNTVMNDDMITDETASYYSDLHKDVYGVRPRGYHLRTETEVREEIVYLHKQLGVVLREEAARDLQNQKNLEEQISNLEADHNIDRRDAFRWIMQAEFAGELENLSDQQGVAQYSMEGIMYSLGVSFSLTDMYLDLYRG